MTREGQGSTSPGHSKIGRTRKETGDLLLWKQALGNISNYLYTLLWERDRVTHYLGAILVIFSFLGSIPWNKTTHFMNTFDLKIILLAHGK